MRFAAALLSIEAMSSRALQSLIILGVMGSSQGRRFV
jgi:hypothetical protein